MLVNAVGKWLDHLLQKIVDKNQNNNDHIKQERKSLMHAKARK